MSFIEGTLRGYRQTVAELERVRKEADKSDRLLKAEIAKLRAALEEIIECYDPIDGMGRVQMTIARDVLKTKTST